MSLATEKIHLRLEGQAHPTCYDRYLDHAILSMPHYPPHHPHLVAARRELESWLFFYFEPRERMRATNPIKEVRHIGLMGEELAAFLRTLKALEPRQFDAVEKALRTVSSWTTPAMLFACVTRVPILARTPSTVGPPSGAWRRCSRKFDGA